MDVNEIKENVMEGAQELRTGYSVSPLAAGGIAVLAYFLGKKVGFGNACQAVAEGIIKRGVEGAIRGEN